MAKKVLDEMPKETETKVAPTKEEAQEALEAVEKEAREKSCDKKCGAKKFILPAVIVAVVAVIGCLGFLGYRLIFGDDPVKITTKAIRGLKDTIKDTKDDSNGMYELISGDDAFEISSKINVSLPQGMGKYDLNMLLQADAKNEAGKLDLVAKQNKKEIANIKAVLDNSKLYFKLADTMKNYYFFDATDIIKEFTSGMSDVETSIDPETLALISKYDFNKLIDYAADSIDSALTKDDFEKSKEEITVKGKDVKATKYTAKIDQKKAIKIVKTFAKKAKNDKDLIKIIAKLTGTKEAEITKAIDEIIDTEPEKNEDGYVLYSVYVSSLGKTLGYGFEVEDLGKVIITNKGDLTTISITYGDYYGSIEINEKSDDHMVITGNLMGMLTAEIDIESDLDTIKKNKEYKETLNVKASVSVMGQTLSGSISSETKVKKIDKVETKDITGAINIEKMTDAQASQFQREVEKSSIYSLIKSLSKTSYTQSIY